MKRKTELYRRMIAIICSVLMVVTTVPVNFYGIAYAEETDESSLQLMQSDLQNDNDGQTTDEEQKRNSEKLIEQSITEPHRSNLVIIFLRILDLRSLNPCEESDCVF